MKRTKFLTPLLIGLVLFLMFGGAGVSSNWAASLAAEIRNEQGDDPDLPAKVHREIDKETYLRLRDEYVGLRRGIEPGHPIDSRIRGQAIQQMETQEQELLQKPDGSSTAAAATDITASAGGSWTPLGPAPLPNGFNSAPVSGRVTSIAVDPTNPNRVYLGAAQGGVWRSLDGGTSWTSIFDSAQSLAIGALALAPSNPHILYVGTGEFNACGDCFFGVGLYRIDNADTSATLVGPINPQITVSNLTYNVFNGRAISKILVHPTNPDVIFVSTARGIGGSGVNTLGLVPTIATRGVYRSTNATSAAGSVTFQKLVVTTDNSPDNPGTGNEDISDMVLDPANPDNLIASAIGPAGSGLASRIYRTTNATGGATFSSVLTLGNNIRVSLAIANGGTVYAATSETPTATTGCTAANSGAVRKSTDGGVTWSGQLTGGGGFCFQQCDYDMPIAVDKNNANLVYIGGQVSSTCGGVVRRSTDGGASFNNDSSGLHPDDHALFFDGAGNIYTGNDGGMWKQATSSSTWTNLNNAPLNTLQFEGIASHPIDRNLMIGGTQDNGTEYQQTSAGNWHNAEGGDGGYALIDQSATDTTSVTMYHTFYNISGDQIGFDRIINTSCLSTIDSWPARGVGFNGGTDPQDTTPACDGTAFYLHNGLGLNDNVLFYAPMALGPGSPNTFYFGTDRLYRSTDRGDTMTVVSQAPFIAAPCDNSGMPCPVSTIAISPQNDNYRVVGLQNGQVWATSTGSSMLVNIGTASFPINPNGSANRFVGRAMIDPNNSDVAYVTFSFFAPAGQGIWKITNLGAAAGASPVAPIWTAAANGIPSVPINAFAIDLGNSNNLFAGTDIGVYNSTDGGATWAPYGTGLPRVAVFDMAIQNANRVLRVGTHGRGVWEIPLASAGPTTIQFSAASYSVGEGDGQAHITVTRTGDSSGAATVDYHTADTDTFTVGCADTVNNHGSAYARCDFATVVGTFSFASGETSKSFDVPIIDDSYAEGNETFSVVLSNATGATIGTPSTATVTIVDNDTVNGPNPILQTNDAGITFFVRQHYLDFLGREPERGEPWSAILRGCADQFNTDPNSPSAACDRITVSGAFFGSPEFKDKGVFVIDLYRVAFNRLPLYSEFVTDLASLVGTTAQEVFARRAAFANNFVQRPEFSSIAALSNSNYVTTLMTGTMGQNYNLTSITTPDPDNPDGTAKVTLTTNDLINRLNANTLTKAQVLRAIVQSDQIVNIEAVSTFVASQYFGYLRRTPDTAGFNSWVNYLTTHPNDFRTMVNGFLNSQEYRLRFGME